MPAGCLPLHCYVTHAIAQTIFHSSIALVANVGWWLDGAQILERGVVYQPADELFAGGDLRDLDELVWLVGLLDVAGAADD